MITGNRTRQIGGKHSGWLWLIGFLVTGVILVSVTGCYTKPYLAGPDSRTGGGKPLTESEKNNPDSIKLPPGHPPIDNLDRWIGRSMLDEFIGEDEPLRFENLRVNKQILFPAENGLFELTIKIGSRSVYDCWHLTIDDFGWFVGARWQQGDAGPQLDDFNASERAEFRLDRDSEAALHTMVIALLPVDDPRDVRIALPERLNLPEHIWAHNGSGIIEFSYQLKQTGMIDKSEWPGGTITLPADIIQLLIGTWSDPPPPELVKAVFTEVERKPMLIDIALLVEGIILAWEVEGEEEDVISLPLRVLR